MKKTLFALLLGLTAAVMPATAQGRRPLVVNAGGVEISYPASNMTNAEVMPDGSLKVTVAYDLDGLDRVEFVDGFQGFELAAGTPTEFHPAPEGEDITLNYRTTVTFEMTVGPETAAWVVPAAENGVIVLHVMPNYTGEQRTATVTILPASATAQEIVLTLIQDSTDNNSPINEEAGLDIDSGSFEYVPGDMPHGDGDEGGVVVEGNDTALPGGSSIVDFGYDDRVKEFYISIEGVDGYYTVVPEEEVFNVDQYWYRITLIFTQIFDHDITLHISGITYDGRLLPETIKTITFVKAGSGALQVSLSFNNAKDIDLHVYTPSGSHIYYGNKGGRYYDEEEQVYKTWGLDVDSNAGCYIDNINNENIFFPESMLEDGVYRVYVNMYSNCNTSIATDWRITATRGGERINNELEGGANPAAGTYRVGAGNGDMTHVMSFTVSRSPEQVSGARRVRVIKAEPSDMDKWKMENDEVDYNLYR